MRGLQASSAWVLVLLLLAGCTAPSDGERTAGPSPTKAPFPGTAWPEREAAFEVLTSAGPATLSGSLWGHSEAPRVLLVLPGSAEVRAMYGDFGSPEVAFGARMANASLAVVALDYPGRGGSGGERQGTEGNLHAALQVVDALRSGAYTLDGAPGPAFRQVVGLGVSTGALVAQAAQALARPFDALVLASWSHGPFSQEARACFRNGDCPEDERSWVFHLPNAEPEVADAMLALAEPPAMAESLGYAAWAGEFHQERDASVPAPEDVSRLVEGRVLLLFGAEDFFFDPAHFAREPSHYPAADVDLRVFEATGHALFHHRNHLEVRAVLAGWLGTVPLA